MMQIILIVVISALLPIAWIMADFRGSALRRRVIGALALLWSFGIAYMVGVLQQFDANAYYTSHTKELLDASISQHQAGRSEAVIREWTRARDAFHPAYENRGGYREIVAEAIEGMKQ
jgi:hypothetical protein